MEEEIKKTNSARKFLLWEIFYIISLLVYIGSYRWCLYWRLLFIRPLFIVYGILLIILPILGFVKKFKKVNWISRKLLLVVLFIPIAIDLAANIIFLSGLLIGRFHIC